MNSGVTHFSAMSYKSPMNLPLAHNDPSGLMQTPPHLPRPRYQGTSRSSKWNHAEAEHQRPIIQRPSFIYTQSMLGVYSEFLPWNSGAPSRLDHNRVQRLPQLMLETDKLNLDCHRRLNLLPMWTLYFIAKYNTGMFCIFNLCTNKNTCWLCCLLFK